MTSQQPEMGVGVPGEATIAKKQEKAVKKPVENSLPRPVEKT